MSDGPRTAVDDDARLCKLLRDAVYLIGLQAFRVPYPAGYIFGDVPACPPGFSPRTFWGYRPHLVRRKR